MKGYPPGTKCVITWADLENPYNGPINPGVGDVVTTGNRIISGLPHVGLLQEVDKGLFGYCCWPIKWMRPLEDPDEQTIEQEDEVTEYV